MYNHTNGAAVDLLIYILFNRWLEALKSLEYLLFSGVLKLADTVTKTTVTMCSLRKSVRDGTRGENAIGP